jgi:predicted  nucleic acid-binding Zn-ribbon protein
MIGATTSQSLDLTLINKGDMVYGTSTIKVEIGLKIGDTTEYILMGIYNIDDIEKTDYTIKITAFDNMIKFETPYFSTLGDTSTLQQVVNELASKTGVQFVGSLPAYNVKKLEGFTCREILGYVASLCGGNAVITRDGKFTIVTPKDNSYSIGTANYIDYKREETKYKIGKVSCQAGEEVLSKGSLGADSMELQFENPWINANILTDIYNKLNGFEYLGYSTKWQGDLSLDVGDIVTITDKKGVVRKHPILSQKFTYTGGLTSEISAKGENKNKNSFSSSGNTANKVNRVVTELLLVNEALINKANIQDLETVSIRTQTIEVKTAQIENAIIGVAYVEDLNVINANIQSLIAADANINQALINKADISQLNVAVGRINTLESGKANITDLTATNANVTNLSTKVATIDTLINGNITSANMAAGAIKAGDAVIANGAISSAQIISLDVEKVSAGDISTNKFRIVSNSGNMLISDNTIQIKDASRVRVQIGKDATNDYNMYVWDSTGKLMFDATGLKADGIKSKIIRNDMVSDTANISGSKLDINSVVTSINGATTTLKASKVKLDTENQTLDIAFTSLKSTATSTANTVSSQGTAISTIQGQIISKIWQTDITNAINGVNDEITLINDKYSTLNQTVDGITISVADLNSSIDTTNGNITSVDNRVSTLSQTVDGIKSTVTSVQQNYLTKTDAGTTYATNTKVSTLEQTVNSLNSTVSSVQTNYLKKADASTTYETKTNVSALSQNLDGFKTTVNNTYSTKTELSGVDGKVSSLTTRVNTVESSITQLNNKIALKVEATEVNSIVNNAVNNVQVGVRNLVKNSTFTIGSNGFESWRNISGNWQIINAESDKPNSKIIKASASGLVANSIKSVYSNTFPCKKGDVLTFSVDVKVDDYIAWDWKYPFIVEFNNSSNVRIQYKDVSITDMKVTTMENNKWYRMSYTATATTDGITTADIRLTLFRNGVIYLREPKVEFGNKSTGWTPAPEDVDQAISTVDSKVETVKNNVSQLTVDLTSITGRVSSTESTISSHTTQLGTVDTRINTAKTSAINTASTDATTKANNAKSGAVSDAKSYTDGQITTVNSTINTKVAEIKATTDSITSRVSSTESSITTINGSVSGLTTRVNSVEQNITATAITTTISSAINAGTSSISTTQFVMDKNGLAIKNGALTIKNKAGATVLTADTDGNLFVQNTLAVGGNTNGNIQVKNASSVNIFSANKNGIFLKDGIMKVTTGSISQDGYNYPDGNIKEMSVLANGINITQETYSGSQVYKQSARYDINNLKLIEDNRDNAEQTYFETIINARSIKTSDIELAGFSKSSASGYTKLPNGIIIQWGDFTTSGINTNSEINPQRVFPLGFPSATLIVIPFVKKCLSESGATLNAEVIIKAVTINSKFAFQTRIKAKEYVSGGVVVGYIAIGY